MTVEQALIAEKISRIEDSVAKMQATLTMADDEILHSDNDLAALERFFQLAVDAALDINYHLIKEGELKSPSDLQSTFKEISSEGILPANFAEKMAPSVGLRNRIVHQYEDVDPRRLVETIRKNIGDFSEYIKYILAYVKK